MSKIISSLQAIPLSARAYTYRVALAVGALVVALNIADVDQVTPWLNVVGVLLNLGAATLATANTPRT